MNKSAIILAILLLTCCNTENEYKTILLKTSGQVEAEPDEASISIQINCVDKNIESAKKCLINKSNALNEKIIGYGISKEDILTTRINLVKDYIWLNNSNVFNGFNASTTINVMIRDLNLLDDLYTNLLSNEELTIGSLTYNYSQIDSLNEIAYLMALDKANSIADELLSELPEKKKVIARISNVEIPKDDIPVEREFKAADAREEMNVNINIGNVIVEQQLYVEYRVYR